MTHGVCVSCGSGSAPLCCVCVSLCAVVRLLRVSRWTALGSTRLKWSRLPRRLRKPSAGGAVAASPRHPSSVCDAVFSSGASVACDSWREQQRESTQSLSLSPLPPVHPTQTLNPFSPTRSDCQHRVLHGYKTKTSEENHTKEDKQWFSIQLLKIL